MFKKFCYFLLIGMFLFLTSGCALLKTAVSAAAAYGISQAF
jgi:hypothetical protein